MQQMLKVLLIEDDPMVGMSYADALSSAGTSCRHVVSCAQALKTLRTDNAWDTIICDHDLSDGTGERILDEISQNEIQSPVIYLTAAGPEVLSRVRQYTVVRKVIEKPAAPEDIANIVNNVASEAPSRARQENSRVIGNEERRMILEAFDEE